MRKILSIFLVVVLLLGAFPATVFADAEFTTTIESTNAVVGNTFDVKIKLNNNPGIAGLTFDIGFDETLLTLSKVTYSTEMGGTAQNPQTLSSPLALVWYSGTAESEYNGTFATLTFTVSDTVKKDTVTTITIDSQKATNIDREILPMMTNNGTISIYLVRAGDIDGDSETDIRDLVCLAQYLAKWNVRVNESALDTNGDGDVDILDLVLLAQYLARWDVEIFPQVTPAECEHENLTAVDAKAATCVSTGNTAYWVCDDCGKCFSDSTAETEITLESTVTKIDPENHAKVVTDPAEEPTDTETGLTEGSHCASCGTVIKEREIIPIPVKEYTVVYNIANGNSYIAENLAALSQQNTEKGNPSKYKEGDEYLLSNLEFPGFTFDGWYDSTNTRIDQITSTDKRNIILYAHWTEEEYSIQYVVFKTPVADITDANKLSYKTSTGMYSLPNPEIYNYYFLGWYDSDGNEVTSIPKGTTGNKVLNAYFTSKRNYAHSEKLEEPLVVCEDTDNKVLYYVYKLGTIENVPVSDPIWTIQTVTGLDQKVSVTKSTTISEANAQTISNTVANASQNSHTWTMSEDWNEVTSANQTWAENHEWTVEEANEHATTSSGTYSTTHCEGGAETTTDTDGTNTLAYNSKNVEDTEATKWDVNGKVSVEYECDLIVESVTAGLEISGGYESSSTDTTNKHTGSDTTTIDTTVTDNTSNWNDSTTYSSTVTDSQSESVSRAVSNAIEETTGISSSRSNGGESGEQIDVSTTSSTTVGSSNTVEYSKSAAEITTTEYSSTGKCEGWYRMVAASTVHVFGIVGYDFNTKSYFTYTYSIVDGETQAFLDYSPDGSFKGDEYTVLPFEIPIDVFDNVTHLSSMTEGVVYRTDTTTKTATVTGYTGTEDGVVIPAYVTSGGVAYKITGITATAFAGKGIKEIALGKFIEEIPDGAFKDCASLETVSGYFTKIGNEAFSGCTAIKDFTVSSAVTSIGTDAFLNVPAIRVNALSEEYALKNSNLESAAAIELTETVVSSAIASGAKSITLDLSSVIDGCEFDFSVPESTYFEINGGNRTFTNMFIDSDAETTVLSKISINTTKGIPLKISSASLILDTARVSSQTFTALLPNATNVTLRKDNALSSATEYGLVCREMNLISENVNGAAGYITVTGNIYTLNGVNGQDNLVLQGESSVITDEAKYNNYIQGISFVTFDANGGNVSEQSRECMAGNAIGAFPSASRTGYDLLGWFTEATGGTQVYETDIAQTQSLYAHWKVSEYTVSWNNCTGANIIVNLESSPIAGAECGTLTSGSTVHYGDVITVSYTSSGSAYYIASNGSTRITVDRNITSSDIWVSTGVYSYTVTWNQGSHTSISVKRTSSPYAGAGTGQLSNGATVYYGDTLSISYGVDGGYSLKHGITSATVTGNIGKDKIYSTATVNAYTYNIYYYSTNGTYLGGTTACYNYGTTNTIYAPDISGYSTPGAQAIAWDSTVAKNIYFYYTPSAVSTYQSLCSGTWWNPNSGYGITYSVAIEYRNRTASTVEAHILWTQSIKGACYGQNQYFNGSIGNAAIGDTLIVNSSRWYNGTTTYYYTDSVTVDSGWVTLSADATTTSVGVSGYWWDAWRSGTWGGTLYIPTY